MAIAAFPPDQRNTSSGIASEFAVGFESANTIGVWVFAHTARTTFSSNAPRCPESPSSVVTFASRIVSSSEGIAPATFQPAARDGGWASSRL